MMTAGQDQNALQAGGQRVIVGGVDASGLAAESRDMPAGGEISALASKRLPAGGDMADAMRRRSGQHRVQRCGIVVAAVAIDPASLGVEHMVGRDVSTRWKVWPALSAKQKTLSGMHVSRWSIPPPECRPQAWIAANLEPFGILAIVRAPVRAGRQQHRINGASGD
jgi:hypothetical protein